MASITYPELFAWSEVENLGDLERLKTILENIPDEKLMKRLEADRGDGRNDYPVRPMWNSLIAAVVYEHISVESLRRELNRNAQLREVCGFDLFSKPDKVVPSASAYSRFLSKLQEKEYIELVENVFKELIEYCYQELPDFGKELGADGKAISSFARKPGTTGDRRGEHDADWGKHEHYHQSDSGEIVKSVKKWFGFSVHVIADTNYELPVDFKVTKASRNEMPVLHEMLNSISCNNIKILDRCEVFTADRGYDDSKLIKRLWNVHSIKPVIDIRNSWKDPDSTKLLPGSENIVYNYKGRVSCVCPKTGETRQMTGGEFEKDREALKFRCPAQYYGYACEGASECPVKSFIRIPCKTNPRIFTPIARSTMKWTRCYNKRTAVERINSRLDFSFGFERHTIRGEDKMRVRLAIGFSVMLAVALGRARQNKAKLMRSLVKPAA